MEAAYGGVDRVLEGLDERQLRQPSGCTGWLVYDLVFHMMLDAERALVAFHTPAKGPADVDFVTYWKPWSASDDSAVSHARFVRSSAAAYSDPAEIVARWKATAAAATRAARQTSPDGFVGTQGHVLSVPDFIATLTVEATIHDLDLIANLEVEPRAQQPALLVTKRTLDGLLGHPPPQAWDDVTYLLKATGRLPLDARDCDLLGSDTSRFPLFS